MNVVQIVSVCFALAVWAAVLVIVVRAGRGPAKPTELRLVPFDANGPIVGKPLRAQWRLRRRALIEAAEICDEYSNEFRDEMPRGSFDAEACAWRIRVRIKEYDDLSPEFAGHTEVFRSERVA